MYRIFISSAANRLLRKSPPQLQRKIKEEVQRLSKNPYLGERLSGPLAFLYSYHFSFLGKPFRIAYAIGEKERKIVIYYFGPRGEFYQRLGRLF